ncbi:MAG TPA: G8 domain-containing protein, partial [Burkholderiaceae bacterium]
MHHDKDGLHPRFIRAAGFALTLALSLSLVPLSARAAQPMSLTQALTTCQTSLPAQGPNSAVTVLAIGAGSSCSAVTIGTGDVAAFNAASPLMPVIVGKGGTLTVSDPGGGHATTLYASSFLIQNGGAMLAGTTAKPVAGQITIVMAGHASAALPPTHNDLIANARDITVMDGGVLALYGAKGISGPADINTLYGTNSWTYLAAPAGPAKYNDTENVSAPVPTTTPATVLTLARVVDWQVNDWIAVATTGFSSHQTEIVQVCGNKPVANPDSGISPTPAVTGVPAYTIANMPQTVSQITLCPATPLKHYHYGGLAPTPGFFPAATTQTVIAGGKPIVVSHQARSFYDNSTRNYGIDERAEVALLSRNIKLTSIAGSRPFVIAGASNTNPVVITVPAGSPVPANGDQVTVGGVLGNTAANGTWTVSASTPGTATAAGSFALQGANGIAGKAYTPGSGTAVVPEGSLQTYAIAGASNASPIVITVPPSTPVPNNGQQVAINSVAGNTAANGTWTVVSSTPGSGTSGGTFALLNSNGTNGGAYTGGGNVVVHEGLYAGAHLVAMHSPPSAATPTLQLVGVELEKFGQAFVGRYPVHLHHVNAPQSTITGAATASKGTNIVISSAAVPADGMFVAVSGVQGDTAANG